MLDNKVSELLNTQVNKEFYSAYLYMTRNLLELGLVKKEKYGTVFLTELGQQKADQYADCYALLLRQIEGSLRCTGADCRDVICELLAATPEENLPMLQMCLHCRDS